MPLDAPKIAVLLATYNGADCLHEQLDSYLAQDHLPALLLVGDDGSTDETLAIIARFATDHPALPVQVIDGPQRGSAANFLNLLAHTPDDIDMIAFSDQDDVWLPEKLRLAVQAMQGKDGPVIYCARTWECDFDLGNRRISRRHARAKGFRNALVQNVAAGNTIVLNPAALALARIAVARTHDTVVHDWWCYQLITGAGGTVIYDDAAVLLYRQHPGNQIGANRGFRARMDRLLQVWQGRLQEWNDTNLAVLSANADLLTPQHRRMVEDFAAARPQGAAARLAMLRRWGFYRQGMLGQWSLYAAAVLGRL